MLFPLLWSPYTDTNGLLAGITAPFAKNGICGACILGRTPNGWPPKISTFLSATNALLSVWNGFETTLLIPDINLLIIFLKVVPILEATPAKLVAENIFNTCCQALLNIFLSVEPRFLNGAIIVSTSYVKPCLTEPSIPDTPFISPFIRNCPISANTVEGLCMPKKLHTASIIGLTK